VSAQLAVEAREEAEQALGRAERQLADARALCSRLAADKEALAGQLAALRQQHLNQLDQHQEAAADLQAELGRARADLDQERAHVCMQLTQMTDLQAQAHQARQLMEQAQSHVESLRAEVAVLKQAPQHDNLPVADSPNQLPRPIHTSVPDSAVLPASLVLNSLPPVTLTAPVQPSPTKSAAPRGLSLLDDLEEDEPASALAPASALVPLGASRTASVGVGTEPCSPARAWTADPARALKDPEALREYFCLSVLAHKQRLVARQGEAGAEGAAAVEGADPQAMWQQAQGLAVPFLQFQHWIELELARRIWTARLASAAPSAVDSAVDSAADSASAPAVADAATPARTEETVEALSGAMASYQQMRDSLVLRQAEIDVLRRKAHQLQQHLGLAAPTSASVSSSNAPASGVAPTAASTASPSASAPLFNSLLQAHSRASATITQIGASQPGSRLQSLANSLAGSRIGSAVQSLVSSPLKGSPRKSSPRAQRPSADVEMENLAGKGKDATDAPSASASASSAEASSSSSSSSSSWMDTFADSLASLVTAVSTLPLTPAEQAALQNPRSSQSSRRASGSRSSALPPPAAQSARPRQAGVMVVPAPQSRRAPVAGTATGGSTAADGSAQPRKGDESFISRFTDFIFGADT
jgi:hypothetical protein